MEYLALLRWQLLQLLSNCFLMCCDRPSQLLLMQPSIVWHLRKMHCLLFPVRTHDSLYTHAHHIAVQHSNAAGSLPRGKACEDLHDLLVLCKCRADTRETAQPKAARNPHLDKDLLLHLCDAVLHILALSRERSRSYSQADGKRI